MKNWINLFDGQVKDLQKKLDELKELRRIGDKPKKLVVKCECEK